MEVVGELKEVAASMVVLSLRMLQMRRRLREAHLQTSVQCHNDF